ncbi:MAG TPA: RtcB family protein [Xanthobacteraceae bacterium]|jgi:tRNA-splicing ligase RtcB|nr:RtcB family protein [Xanthobacteraceae bacterium]
MEPKIFGSHDERTLAQMDRCMRLGSVAGGVLCADGHLGYAMPVGGVIAYEEHVSISGVGFDIGCGNMAAKLDLRLDDIKADIPTLASDIAKAVSFGLGRSNAEKVEHELFDSPLWDDCPEIEPLKTMAREQLGTVGSGNHYVDLFADEDGYVWIGVHFGSRGLGHKTATRFLKLAGGKDGIDVEPALLHQDSELAQRYLAGMTLAGWYAEAGREWVVEKVRSLIGGAVVDTVHNHHNYAWRERHGDRDLWVVRKGATPAFPGQRGFVGGSMGDDAVILAGVASDAAAASFYSTVHGAGRVMSRTQARGRSVRDPATGKRMRQPGRVRHDEMQQWLREKGVTLVGGDLDEAPQAYRRLPDVLAAHAGTVRIEHTLRPFAVVMAGASEFDPYKD